MAGSNTDTEGNGGHRSPEGWNRLEAMIAGFAAPATERMLDLCGVDQGLKVLDVAAGTGLPSLQIAELVGEKGSVLATDMSGEMLGILKKKAEAAGLSNVETRIMDGQDLDVPDGSFDAIVSQFGLMLFPDPDQSLKSMFNAVRPVRRYPTKPDEAKPGREAAAKTSSHNPTLMDSISAPA